jgi:hypothetical protein
VLFFFFFYSLAYRLPQWSIVLFWWFWSFSIYHSFIFGFFLPLDYPRRGRGIPLHVAPSYAPHHLRRQKRAPAIGPLCPLLACWTTVAGDRQDCKKKKKKKKKSTRYWTAMPVVSIFPSLVVSIFEWAWLLSRGYMGAVIHGRVATRKSWSAR